MNIKIEHIALWVNDLEVMRAFYTNYFGMSSNELYRNEKKQFSSYFLSFQNGPRIELIHKPGITNAPNSQNNNIGLAHSAISVGSKKNVDELTTLIKKEGFVVLGEPRTTGDGYYESVIVDPEGNTIEITI